uniref:hypothetical protein n=1 Tax=Endozoicomonas atrinae TaxID=1333660 RepID=UPI001112F4C2
RVSLVKYLTFWNYQTCRPPQKAILNDRSFWTGVLRTFYAGDDKKFFQDILNGEFLALEALEKLASAVGMAMAERESYEPEPGAQAYSAYMAWLCQYGSDAEVAGALSINLATWGAGCARMARALQNLYGFKEPDLLFFSRFAESPVEVGSTALAIIDRGLKEGIAPRRIRRSVRMLQGYELLFWDTVYKLSVGGESGC